MSAFRVSRAFEPRPTRFLGALPRFDWRIKRYAIHLPDQSFDEARFDDGVRLATATLPREAVTEARPGAAILILHQADRLDYAVLAWWDRENELPIHVWMRENKDAWRAARDGESVCVWDLDVIRGERDLYIRHVLSRPDAPDIEAYLNGDASP